MNLRRQTVRVAAPRELVFEVVSSAGKTAEKSSDERFVEFETSWRGHTYKTVEAVTVDPPHRIGYRWISGPLGGVEEEITLDEVDRQTTDMSYRGSFTPPRGFAGWFKAVTVVRPIFNKLVRRHLDKGRNLSEARALRSHLYRRDTTES